MTGLRTPQQAPFKDVLPPQRLLKDLRDEHNNIWTDLNRIDATTLRLVPTPPATSTGAGTAGDVAYQSGTLYLCVQNNLWIKWNVINSF